MYRTGDRVRRLADGNLEFLGRADRQVKINGKRVELDEIEACLRRSTLIDDAAVTSPPAAAGQRKIYAYVKSKRDPAALNPDLRTFLRQELPDYMLPASIVVLDSFPLSPTGKVDRGKLPQPAVPAAAGVGARMGGERLPRSAMETALMKIWSEVLGRESVGTHDNFFDLGGTSLQVVEIHARIRATVGCDITVVDLFQYPQISGLAAALVRRAAPVTLAASGTLSTQERARRQQAALARARPTADRRNQ